MDIMAWRGTAIGIKRVEAKIYGFKNMNGIEIDVVGCWCFG